MSNRQPRALRRIAGNLTGATAAGADRVEAWYMLHPVQWPYRSVRELETSIDILTRGAAQLAGRDVHLRVSTVEYPVADWARRLNDATPNPSDPVAWQDHLLKSQQVLHDRPMSEPVVMLGVTIGAQSTLDRFAALFLRQDKTEAAETARKRFEAELSTLDAILDDIARPATQLELEWLIRRSVGVCLPVPPPPPGAGDSPVAEDDLASFFDDVDVETPHGFARTVKVTGYHTPTTVDRHVAVLSVGRMEEQRIPEEHTPWLARVMQFPGVEISARFRVMTGQEAASEVTRKIDRLMDEEAQTRRFGIEQKPHRDRVLTQAKALQDTMQNAWSDDAVTCKGQVRIAIDGDTPEHALARAHELKLHMRKQRIDLGIMRTPAPVLTEFVPGNKRVTTEYTRRMQARLFAASVPQLSGAIGDRTGLRRGYVVSGASRQPFMWDMHAAMVEDGGRSGVTPVAAEQGAGKALALDTVLSTPTGWTTMGEVQAGDELLGSDGKPTRVVAATEVMTGRPCYRVTFSTGETIIADAEHQWLTVSVADRNVAVRRARRLRLRTPQPLPVMGPGLCECGCGETTRVMTRWNSGIKPGESRRYVHGHQRGGKTFVDGLLTPVTRIRTTEQIAATLQTEYQANNHAVRLAEPLTLPDADLPIPAYTFGAWLGDGTSSAGYITSMDREILDRIEQDGLIVDKVTSRHAPLLYSLNFPIPEQPINGACAMCGSLPRPERPRVRPLCQSCWSKHCVKGRLRSIGVLHNKHIPVEYLRASEQQRRDLLAGLLDTDGWVTKHGGSALTLTSRRLVNDAMTLITSLGIKASMSSKKVRGHTAASSVAYTIHFTPDTKVFYLHRKASAQQTKPRTTQQYRYITAVEPIESVPVRCVQVDNDDHTYLVGSTFIPTHNSWFLGATAALSCLQGDWVTFVDPPGTAAGIARWEPIADKSSVLDVMSTRFSPFALFPTPDAEEYLDSAEVAVLEGKDALRKAWQLARDAEKEAMHERAQLTLDLLLAVLPHDPKSVAERELLLADAIHRTECKATTTVEHVLTELASMASTSGDKATRQLSDALERIADLPRARNWMRSGPVDDQHLTAKLLAIKLDNLSLPTSADPAEWDTSQRLGVALLALSMHFAAARVWRLPRWVNKTLVFDESHLLSGWPSMRVLAEKLNRQSRKYRVRVFYGSQDVDTTLTSQKLGTALVNDCIIGQLRSEEQQAKATAMLGIHPSFGAQIGQLRRGKQRAWLVRVNGQVGLVEWTLEEHPELMELLDTRPTQASSRDLVLAKSEGWFQ